MTLRSPQANSQSRENPYLRRGPALLRPNPAVVTKTQVFCVRHRISNFKQRQLRLLKCLLCAKHSTFLYIFPFNLLDILQDRCCSLSLQMRKQRHRAKRFDLGQLSVKPHPRGVNASPCSWLPATPLQGFLVYLPSTYVWEDPFPTVWPYLFFSAYSGPTLLQAPKRTRWIAGCLSSRPVPSSTVAAIDHSKCGQSELRWVKCTYKPDFKDLVWKRVKHSSLIIFLLVTYWNDIFNILG